MLISIITSTFNSDQYLKQSFASYQIQNYADKELIVIDGGSKDNTKSIINEHQEIIGFYLSESDKGIYDALNKGIAHASGEVIGILHSDDLLYDDEVLTRVSELFKQDSTLQAVYGDLEYVNRNNPDKVIRKWISGKYNPWKLSHGWMPPHPALFIRKQCFLDYGNYNLQYKSAADYDLILRFLYKHNIKTAYLPKFLVKMRVGGTSNLSLKNRWRANKEDRLAMKLNGIKYPLIVSIIKPLSKLIQFFK